MPRVILATFALLVAVLALPNFAGNAWAQEITVTIKGHRFEPTEIRIPAGKRVTIYVDNQDPTLVATGVDFVKHQISFRLGVMF